jgi:hypothetical protein
MGKKSKITKLFDWTAYEKAHTDLDQKPEDTSAAKKVSEEDKKLRTFEAAITKDIKLGLSALQEALKKGEDAKIPYFLYLGYFKKAKEGSGSLLILGKQPAIKKAFTVIGKTGEKINLSYGVAQLDSNNILRFVPEKNGTKVKPKPLVDSLKKAPISKSNPGFWAKRKVSNVIIGALEEELATLTGDSGLVEEAVTYRENGANLEVYDTFKSFVNRDYKSSNGTRNAEYYAQTLTQVDEWVVALQAEFKAKGDKTLKDGYTQMGKIMMAFKVKVQQEMEEGKSQTISEKSSLSTIEQVFERTLKEYNASKDLYQKSILKSKLERIFLELEQKINGDDTSTEALDLKSRLKEALASLNTFDSETTVDPAVQQQVTQLLQEMEQLLQQYESAPSI